MTEKSELAALAEARACLYRFLGSIYIMEIDEQMLGQIKGMKFPKTLPESDLREGYDLIRNYVKDNEVDSLEELAADYAKIFLAAGEAQGLAAFPYESIYTGKKHEFVGDAQQEVRALYAARGWEPRKDMFRIMEDHIGLELEFMAILCGEMKEAVENGKKKEAESVLEEQQTFLKNHLLNWTASFTSDVNKYAQTDFYRGAAKVTSGFLKLEKQFLNLGGAAWDIE